MAVGEIKKLDFLNGVAVTEPDLSLSGSGSGEINLIINPDGGTDLDQSATDDVGDWIDSGTSVVASVTETAAEIPLSPTNTTAIKLTVGSSGTDYTRVRFRVPDALYNTKLKIAWYQLYGSTYATGDLKLELYNYSNAYSAGETEIALASDSSGTTSIPAKNGQFVTTFDADGREYYELRFVRTANGGAATDFISLNNVVVGPGVRAQGAVVTEWESFTPTGNFSGGTNTGYKRRVGGSLEVILSLNSSTLNASSTTITIPDSLTIDTSKLPNTSTFLILGHGTVLESGVAADIVQVHYESTTAVRLSSIARSSASNHNLVNLDSTAPFSFSTNDEINVQFKVPIAEWSGSGTLNVLQEDNLKEWTAFTPGTPTNFALSSAEGYYRRVGSEMQVKMQFTASGNATGDIVIDPADYLGVLGLSVDTSKFFASGFESGFCSWYARDSSLSGNHSGSGYITSAGAVVLTDEDGVLGNGGSGRPFGAAWATGDYLSVSVQVPIAEWANTQPSLVGYSEATSTQAGLVFKPQYIVDQNSTALSNATASDIGTDTLTIPAGTYLAELGAVSRVVTSVDPTTIRVDVNITDDSNNVLGTVQTHGGMVESSSGNWLAMCSGMTEFTVATETTIKLRGQINVSGGTVTSRNFDDGYIKVTKQ